MTKPPCSASAVAAGDSSDVEEGRSRVDIGQVEASGHTENQAAPATSPNSTASPISNLSRHAPSSTDPTQNVWDQPSPGLLSAMASAEHSAWDALWDEDESENDTGEDEKSEEKHEIGISYDNRIGLDPISEGRASFPRGSLPFPLLSIGPYSSTGNELNGVQASSPREDPLGTPSLTTLFNSSGGSSSTPIGPVGAVPASSLTPGSRGLHHRKPSVPRLGMLQNAQDLVSSIATAPVGSPLRRGTVPNLHSARPSDVRRVSLPVGLYDPHSVGTTFWKGGTGVSPHDGLINSAAGGGTGSGGETRGLKARANSLKRVLGNLPGPKQILQVHDSFLQLARGNKHMHLSLGFNVLQQQPHFTHITGNTSHNRFGNPKVCEVARQKCTCTVA